MSEENIDYLRIQEDLKEKHNSFIDGATGFANKVSGDSLYVISSNTARLTKILSILQKLEVIDSISTKEMGHYKSLTISKSGFGRWVEVFISEEKIVVSIDPERGLGLTNPFRKSFTIENTDKWWHNFSIEFLDFIHATIYERQKIADQKIKTALGTQDA
jgi:hypothetical protein